ncbi:restriction endonuclease subunit S [Megasphaera coli]|uniref:restriction endonuclease subunit S n=1 Tax=Colibacter massiliensis TaxID=1852379 RepID=UPI00094EE5F4|nr:restriction endonuclease subunit S [Colibacter massiliensis]
MVALASRITEKADYSNPQISKDELSWSIVSLSDILSNGKRLEASVFDIEAKHAREIVKKTRYNYKYLSLEEDFAECFTCPRFKRLWLEKSDYPIYQPSSILDVYPTIDGYISKLTKTNIDKLRVKKGQVLITCSGTIGNVSMVNKTTDNQIFSHDLLRVRFKEEVDNGFFYTFLKTSIGRAILISNKYGSVISHIEASHMDELIIPNPPYLLKKKIHDLVIDSYSKRDESNDLIDEATRLLIDALELPTIDDLKKEAFSYSRGINSFSTKLSDLDGRLEGSYHIPLIEVIERYISKKAIVKNLNSEDITEKIILPGRFKRIYVEKGNGKVFLGGKEINQLDPSSKKFLSIKHYSDKLIRNIAIEKNDVLVTRSGSVGRVMLAPEHWQNWISSDHVIRISSKKSYHGLIFTWLASEYGKELMKRQIYGSVVDEITDKQLGDVVIPVFKEDTINNSILSLINKANELRYHAYKQEQKAIEIMNREVLGL